jgi:hypothetical protein
LGLRRDEVTGGWRKLHNEEFHSLYSSPGIIRVIKSMRMRWARHEANMRENMNAYRILKEKPEGKKPLGRPRYKCTNSMKMDLRTGCMDWTYLGQHSD